jgi:hypothetical protein
MYLTSMAVPRSLAMTPFVAVTRERSTTAADEVVVLMLNKLVKLGIALT